MTTLIHHVGIVSLPVADQDRSIAFFRDTLGFEVRRDAPMGSGGARWIEIAPPGAKTSLTLVTWFDAMQPGGVQGLVLNTTDIEKTHAGLSKKKVEVSAIQNAPWGRYCTLKDPDKNGLVIVQEPSA